MAARKFGLDVVRAVAIGLVLLSHFFAKISIAGVYGVELFFALSGFLIGGILYRRLTSCERWTFAEVKLFWLRRWWRTLPNYYLFLAISIPLHLYFVGGLTFSQVFPFLIFSQNHSGVTQLYAVSWSLCVEEWFYLLFPLCIFLFISLRLSKKNAFICTTLLFLLFPPAMREFLFAKHDPATVRMLTLPRLDAIFYGVATSFIVARHPISLLMRKVMLCLGAAGLACFVALYVYSLRAPQFEVAFYRLAFVGLPLCSCLLLPFFESIERMPAKLAFLERPIENISLWSYSIYLSHIPILTTIYTVFEKYRVNPYINLLSKLAGLAICLTVSRFIYVHFEARLLRMRPKEPPPRHPSPPPEISLAASVPPSQDFSQPRQAS